MQFLEALKLVRAANQRDGELFTVSLVAGCSTISLTTFLHAHLSESHTDRRFTLIEAPYGDIVDSLKSAYAEKADAVAVVLEFASLDARLGLRRASSWTEEAIVDILRNVESRLDFIRCCIGSNENRRTIIHPPILQLPPIEGCGSWQASAFEASLQALMNQFCVDISGQAGVFIAKPDRAAVGAPRDVDGELTADFPYSQPLASLICDALAKTIFPPVALKGIITDLDDTLWRGLVGEVGSENVHWTLDGKSQIHAIYQQMLAACASRGILVAVASKNNQATVDAALARTDILIKPDQIFPIIANWEPKSRSVAQILSIWNISADAVVFVDDNQYEIDEVKRAHPTIHTRRFLPEKAGETYQLIKELRDLCHRETSSAEDKLRLASIRAAASLTQEAADAPSMDDFLAGLAAEITFEPVTSLDDKRPFELVNKTNQFNLNGKRYTEGEWAGAVGKASGIVLAIRYKDKFGELGRIGVLLGNRSGSDFVIDQWVLSCRAFSRRIEHATLKVIIGLFHPDNIRFNFVETAKNGPVRGMLVEFAADETRVASVAHIESVLPEIYATIAAPEANLGGV